MSHKLRHPSDGMQWKSFNAKFAKEFGDKARNVRFALIRWDESVR